MIPTLIHDLSIHVIGKHVLMFHKPKRRPCFLQCGTWGQYKGEAVGEHLCQLSVSSAWPSPWRARPCNSHLNSHRLSKKTILIQSSLGMALNPREATEHARTTQGSSFKAPDRSQCQHPPHPDHHPNKLASHRGPIVSLHQVGALFGKLANMPFVFSTGFSLLQHYFTAEFNRDTYRMELCFKVE